MPSKTLVQNSNLEIIHLMQMHAIPGFTYDSVPKEVKTKVISSQFKIAQYLIKNPELPVVVESYYVDIDHESPEHGRMNALAKTIFPSGFPSNLEALNDVQKNFIYLAGAPEILVYLEVLPKIFKSTSRESADEADYAVEQGDFSKIFSFREEIALKHVKKAADLYYDNDQQGKKVILIFGGAHSFQKKCNQYGYKLTEINYVDRDALVFSKAPNEEVSPHLSHKPDSDSIPEDTGENDAIFINHLYNTLGHLYDACQKNALCSGVLSYFESN